MMLLLRLFYEYAKVGLFAVGGGLATVPFLQHMGETTGWFTDAELSTMIAVSESTPGPMGVNMATYVGFKLDGVAGAVVATLGLIFPSIVVILIIAGFLQKFRQSRRVDAVFRGLRPASTALIASAGLSVAVSVFFAANNASPDSFPAVRWEAVLLAVAVFACMQIKGLKKLHPICFIAAAAAVGVVFQFCNISIPSSISAQSGAAAFHAAASVSYLGGGPQQCRHAARCLGFLIMQAIPAAENGGFVAG